MSFLVPSRSSLILVGLLSMAAFTAAPVGAAEPAEDILGVAAPIEGIDVSHHQNEINWGRVRRDGKRFAFIKVTEGERYIDPLYAYNHRNARNAGLRSGAYHFAQPNAEPGSAVRQADHFLAWFNLHDGDLLPVLDLEETNDLDPAALTDWTLAWLNRVRERTGLAAVLYVSPKFWINRLEDTTAIAAAGYTLWIADWDSDTPTTPAAGWADAGWSVWQYDNCGRVPGITGCALMDYLVGPLDRFVYRGPGFPLTGDNFAPIVTKTRLGRYPDESVRGPEAPRKQLHPGPRADRPG
ncbi:MAG TPA: glycoside hydrolase family 25 protein [Candidatus Eisenbacteria bacterium]|nr:glycoside hydrolase family 25 protein [Candidatus Eisenbacteria bacterium]